jgi:WD40 repeat protein
VLGVIFPFERKKEKKSAPNQKKKKIKIKINKNMFFFGGQFKIRDAVMSMAHDRGLVAVGHKRGNIDIRESISGDRVRGWKGNGSVVRTLAFTRDGKLVSGSVDKFVTKWDVETGTVVWSRDAGVGSINGISELADGRLVVGGVDRSARVLDGGPHGLREEFWYGFWGHSAR